MVLTERSCCVPSSAKTHRVVWTRLSVVVSIQAAALCLQEWVFVFCAGGDWGYTRSQLPGWHWHWWHRFLQLPLSPGHKSVFSFSYLFRFYTCIHALVEVSNFLCHPNTGQWGGFLTDFYTCAHALVEVSNSCHLVTSQCVFCVFFFLFLQLPLSAGHQSQVFSTYFYTCAHAKVKVSNFPCHPTTSQCFFAVSADICGSVLFYLFCCLSLNVWLWGLYIV